MSGKTIRNLRGNLGWSQTELGERVGVSKQTVSNWENGNIQPSIDVLVKLSRVFGVSADYLLGLDPVPRLSLDGLSSTVVAHLSALVEDFRSHR